MNITHEVKKLERSSVKLSVTVPQNDVGAAYDSVLQKFAKKAQIPGFRKGHVPLPVLERKFGADLKNEAALDIIESALKDLLETVEPKPYSQPELDAMPEFDAGKDLSFAVVYDVYPEVHVTDFAGITIKEPQVTVNAQDVQNELERIQDRNALVLDKKDGEGAAAGDLVTVSWHEIDAEQKIIDDSVRNGVVLTAGKPGSYFELEDDVLGMKTGESKEIIKQYKADHANEDLAGKEIKFSLTVDAVKIKELPPIDDELAQDVSGDFKTLDDLKASIIKRLETQKDARVEELKVRALIDAIIERTPMEIPDSMLKADLDSRIRGMAAQLGMSREQMSRLLQNEHHHAELYASWAPESERRIKSSLIVTSLMKEKNIAATDEDIEEEYKSIAGKSGAQLDEVKARYADEESKEYLADVVKEKKLFKELFSLVKIEKGDTVSLEELLHND